MNMVAGRGDGRAEGLKRAQVQDLAGGGDVQSGRVYRVSGRGDMQGRWPL